MFCPEGYVSVAELWAQYRQKRLKDFYRTCSAHYAEPDFSGLFVRGSPLDICEHIFLKSASLCGLCLSAPDGRIMKIQISGIDSRASLCSVLSVQGSRWSWAAHEVEADAKANDSTLEMPGFHPWHGEPEDDELWSNTYPIFDLNAAGVWRRVEKHLKFHCLPLCFERPTYTVVRSLPPWSRDIRIKGDLLQFVENFGGWAICMSVAAVEAWQTYLRGKGIYADQLQFELHDNSKGRPKLQTNARRDFELTFPGGRDVVWKSVPDRIKSLTGNSYSVSTIQRALRDTEED